MTTEYPTLLLTEDEDRLLRKIGARTIDETDRVFVLLPYALVEIGLGLDDDRGFAEFVHIVSAELMLLREALTQVNTVVAGLTGALDADTSTDELKDLYRDGEALRQHIGRMIGLPVEMGGKFDAAEYKRMNDEWAEWKIRSAKTAKSTAKLKASMAALNGSGPRKRSAKKAS